MPGQMPRIYEGHDEYVFVSYAHADRDVALSIIRALTAEGYRVWYDDGVQKGSKYPDYIANHVYRCSRFIALLSESSKASEWCDQEVHFALNLHKWVLPVYLDEVELDLGLRMRLVTTQAMYWYRYDADIEFLGDLLAVKMLDCCLTNDGKRRRGVKPRSVGAETGRAVASQSTPIQAESKIEPKHEFKPSTGSSPSRVSRAQGGAAQTGVGVSAGGREGSRAPTVVANMSDDVPGVTKRDELADYTWAELKKLSKAIAAAGSDEEGLGVAKAYGLVDKDGKLRGDAKEVVLGDKGKTKAHVRILGFRHDELAGGGRAGISFEFADAPVTHRMNLTDTNAGGWERSEMRGWLDGEFLASLPEELRTNVAAAMKRTNNRGWTTSPDGVSVVTPTPDRLWLLSSNEVYGGLTGVYGAEGVQYKLYADKGVTTKSCASCAKSGANSWWWLRSPIAYSSYGFHFVFGVGDWVWRHANLVRGVSPGFCF